MASARGQRIAAGWNALQLGNNQAMNTAILNDYNRDRPLEQLDAGAARARGAFSEYFPQALGALGKGYGQSREDVTGYGERAFDTLGTGFGQAREAVNNFMPQALGALGQGFGAAREGVTDYGMQGLDALGQGFGQAQQTIQDSAPIILSALGRGFDQARGDINQGVDRATGFLQQNATGFEPWRGNGANASGAVADFLGLGGADGTGRARAALETFRAGTGYRDTVDQATDAVARRANALGMTGSGNTMDAIARLGARLADQSAGSYLNNLQGVSGQGLQAAGMQGQALAGLANLEQGRGSALASLAGQRGAAESAALSGQADRLANLATGRGAAEAQTLGQMGATLGNLFASEAGAGSGLLANQGQMLSNLATGQGAAQAGVLGQMGTTLGQMGIGQGAAESGLYSGMGNALANLETNLGQNKANIYTGLGNALTNLNNQTTGQITQGMTQAGQAGDAAKVANQNLTLGAIGQVLRLFGVPGGGGAGGDSNPTGFSMPMFLKPFAGS